MKWRSSAARKKIVKRRRDDPDPILSKDFRPKSNGFDLLDESGAATRSFAATRDGAVEFLRALIAAIEAMPADAAVRCIDAHTAPLAEIESRILVRPKPEDGWTLGAIDSIRTERRVLVNINLPFVP